MSQRSTAVEPRSPPRHRGRQYPGRRTLRVGSPPRDTKRSRCMSSHMRLIDAQGAQLSLDESREPGSVFLVELLQRFDLLLQRFTLRVQAPGNILILLLGLMLEFIGIRLGIFCN